MAWISLPTTIGENSALHESFFVNLVCNLLESGANRSVTRGDILFGKGKQSYVDNNGNVGRLAIVDGSYGNFVSVGADEDIIWSSGAANLSYRQYNADPSGFAASITDDAYISKIPGLAFVEAFSRARANLLSAVVEDSAFMEEELTRLGGFAPRVAYYDSYSSRLALLSNNSPDFSIGSDANDMYDVWNIPADSIYRIGVVTINSASGIPVFYILDVKDGVRIPDIEAMSGLEETGSRDALYKISDDWNVSLSSVESLLVTNSFTYREISGKPSLAIVDGLSLIPSNDSIAVSWNSVSNATSYIVQYRTSGQSFSSSSRQFTTTATSRTISGLSGETSYFIRVRGEAAGYIDEDAWSDEERATTEQQTLDRVRGLSVSADGSNAINTSWSSVFNADNYIVQWRTSSQSFSTSRQLTTNGTSRRITGLSSNTTYYVRVRATASGLDDGDWSFENSATTEAQQLGRVSIHTGRAPSSSSIFVDWSSISGATSYIVQWRRSTQSFSTSRQSTTSSSSRTITGLLESTTYFVRVRATASGFLDGEWSAEFSVMTDAAGLGQTSITSISSTETTISFAWSSVASATSYTYQWRSSSQSFSTSRQRSTSSRSATVASLNSGTLYYVRVRATASGLTDGAWSSTRSVRTDTPAALGQVSGVRTSRTGYISLHLAWGSVTGASVYEIQWRTSSQAFTNSRRTTSTVASVEVTGLSLNTSYIVRVRATASGVSSGPWSSELTFSTSATITQSPVSGGWYNTNSTRQYVLWWTETASDPLYESIQISRRDSRDDDDDWVNYRIISLSTSSIYRQIHRSGNTSALSHSNSASYFDYRMRYMHDGMVGPWGSGPRVRTTRADTTIVWNPASSVTLNNKTDSSVVIRWSGPDSTHVNTQATQARVEMHKTSTGSLSGAVGSRLYQKFSSRGSPDVSFTDIPAGTYTVSVWIVGLNANQDEPRYRLASTPVHISLTFAGSSSRSEEGDKDSSGVRHTAQPVHDHPVYGAMFAFIIDDDVSAPTIPSIPYDFEVDRVSDTSVTATWDLESDSDLSGLTDEIEVRYRVAYVDDGSGSRDWATTMVSDPSDDSVDISSLSNVVIASDSDGSDYDLGFWHEFQIRAVNTATTPDTYSPWSLSRYVNLARST